MDPLSAVENHLRAAVDTWPTFIITQLYVEEPSKGSLRDVATFMYGNRVPLRLAVECFKACNGAQALYVEEKCMSGTMYWTGIFINYVRQNTIPCN